MTERDQSLEFFRSQLLDLGEDFGEGLKIGLVESDSFLCGKELSVLLIVLTNVQEMTTAELRDSGEALATQRNGLKLRNNNGFRKITTYSRLRKPVRTPIVALLTLLLGLGFLGGFLLLTALLRTGSLALTLGRLLGLLFFFGLFLRFLKSIEYKRTTFVIRIISNLRISYSSHLRNRCQIPDASSKKILFIYERNPKLTDFGGGVFSSELSESDIFKVR